MAFDALINLRVLSTNLETEGERLRRLYLEGEKEPVPWQGFERQEL